MVSTNYQIYSDARDGYAGQVFSNVNYTASTFLNVGVPLPIGSAVVAGNTTVIDTGTGRDKPMQLPDGTVRKFLGILILENFYEKSIDANGDSCIPSNYYGTVYQKGRIKVRTEVPVTVSDPVYYRNAAGTNTILGRFTNVADSGTCVLIPNATWYRGNTQPGLAVVDINVP
jgi:hypothetical protein